ncbi:lysine N(6)-hydroxylase/L-ornithine N(5)-oxygenase family protein [Legionella gresilensis]|uniref:lysine N(6)-hydroxylase/L-ornithine N(5)-oxygenase family protein n=1 Tax=Legionella gresilensis TaxID=91823 RepID=UPI001040FCB5|nr:SidA/IucD/PvdA family monooxygenase [Legionella gresilensis]
MIKGNQTSVANLLGVGIGPFNLSLAALLSPIKSLKSYFFDQNPSFIWHPGMLVQDAEIQVSYLKDLVTLVDPTNPYSFISYLAKHKRLYRFMNAQFSSVFRIEFNHYLNWVSRSLPNLIFKEKVEDIQFKNALFTMRTSRRVIQSQHLVLGNGLSAHIPDAAKTYLSHSVFHNKDFLTYNKNLQGKKVAVIGGGQSGAEIIHNLLSQTSNLPQELIWITRRNLFTPLDDSTFTNDLFTPSFNHYFFNLTAEQKISFLNQHRLVSDGISLNLLNSIYRKIYILEFLENKGRFYKLIFNHELKQIRKNDNTYNLTIQEIQSRYTQVISADIIILCTGYKWEYPSYLQSLADRIPLQDNRYIVNQDFSLQWDGPTSNRIYVQNASRQIHGLADPNFCLMAWRSATIINSLCEKEIYDLSSENCVFDINPANNFYEENSHVSYA